MTRNNLKILLTIMAGLAILDTGCSQPKSAAGRQLLSPEAAGQLAAKLVNEECVHHHWKKSFTAAQYSAVLKDGMYHWGGLDVFAQKGISALVTFRQDGSAPHVDLYYSESIVRAELVHPDWPQAPQQILIYR